MVSVYQNLTNNNITIKDREMIDRYVNLIQWGRKNPVRFIEDVLGVPLLDYQRWLVTMTWCAEYAVWVCSRNAGKSFLLGCFLQARSLLFPKSKIHIMSTGSRQANETFETMENIIKRNVVSLKTVNSVFKDEIKKSNADTDGFTHDPKKGNGMELLNGSFVRAVTGTSKTVRGKRSNVNAYDEAGTIPRDFFEVTEPFMAQSSNFAMTDDGVNREAIPETIPNLRLYIGSASDTNSYFWDKYVEGLTHMLIGETKYFAADIDCEIPMHPTRNGQPVKPLLQQEEIDRKMRENEILANREYHNIFDRFSIEDSVVSRTDIVENTENFVPHTHWGGKKHKYAIFYDPASKVDNSPVLVMEWGKDEDGVIRGRLVHMENLLHTYNDGSHKPMRLDEQVQRLREMIYEYNGKENITPYDNIEICLDAGSGGQAPALVQELVKDWTDGKGRWHPGLMDEGYPDLVRWGEKYPHAIKERMHVLEPSKYRKAFFDAAKEEVPAGNIKFPPSAPKHDVLILDDGEERKLSKDEVNSLVQMDLMKEEAVNIVRSKTPSGNVTYGLPPDKRNKMHDDRNYVFVMACWFIKQKQISDTLGEVEDVDYKEKYLNRVKASNTAKAVTRQVDDSGWGKIIRGNSSGHKPGKSPFAGDNPFRRN